jgi:site-specific DNA-methyltransferase (adenine-specific)
MPVIHGNCLQVLPTLGQFNLVFCDPPFNLSRQYDVYNDKRTDYLDWCLAWIELAWQHTDGVLCLHGPDDLAEIYLYAARQFSMTRIAWVNPWYDFGQCKRTNWVDARCHCLIFARNGYTWNPGSVLIPSARASTYNDPRIHDTERGGLRLPGTVWGVGADGRGEKFWGRVQGNNKERRPLHDNQLPELYLERLILAYTNEGDSVLDPFGGSGTTITVAQGLNRHGTTIELSEVYCKSIEQRLREGMVR